MMQNYSLIKYFVYLFPIDKANLLKVIIFVDDTSNNPSHYPIKCSNDTY